PRPPPVGGGVATSRLTCIGASEKFTYAPIMAAGEDMSNRVTVPLKIREIPDATLRRKLLESQRDDGRPSEDDIVREHFGPRGEKQDDPAKLPVEANTRRDWPAGSTKPGNTPATSPTSWSQRFTSLRTKLNSRLRIKHVSSGK